MAAPQGGDAAQQACDRFWDPFTAQAPAAAVQADHHQPIIRLQDIYTADYIMYEYKVQPCSKTHYHDWALCPYTHPAEKSRRRSPKTYTYCSVACPNMKQFNACPRGDSCHMSHSVYEFWLHPERFNTEMCRMGSRCTRKVCFFAHKVTELRVPHISAIHKNSPGIFQGSTADPTHSTPAPSGAGGTVQTSIKTTPGLTVSIGQQHLLQPAQTDCHSSNASVNTPCAATVFGPTTLSSAAGGGGGGSSSGSGTATPQHMPYQQQAFQPRGYRPHPFQANQGPNRQQRRQNLQGPQLATNPRPPIGPNGPLSLFSPAVTQGLLANLAAAPGSAAPNAAAVLAAMQQLQAQLGMSAAPAIQSWPLLGNFQAAQAAANQPSFLQAPTLMQYAQQAHSWVQSGQQQQQPGGFAGYNQPVLINPNHHLQPSNVNSQLLQQGGLPVPGGALTASQFPPGILYQQVPAAAAVGDGMAAGASLQPLLMQHQHQQQMVLIPVQLGGQAAGLGGRQDVCVAPTSMAGGAAVPVHSSAISLQPMVGV